ncbi:MAG: 2-C-methyl-D-erythritol 4-phosphate cytidylyltransferase [Bacteroidales bacterium]|nr:2-C-methyl-D-erythritol 4-phosphate cytidylyltransferase [Bacteroidales bacterium]MCF8397515.1 2-C-methyl-D-erythritol 4-phosphate cytidylyltransferase [Bacteroidales bacterium]
MSRKEKYLVIVAGGTGKRMQSAIPKQFLRLLDKPVLMHVFDRFYAWDPGFKFILVLPGKHIDHWKKLIEEYDFRIPHITLAGGKERFESVQIGLNAIDAPVGFVGIHDGVRPLVTNQLIQRVFENAEQLGNAVPVVPVRESVRWMEKDQSKILDRSKIRLVQTPQVFDLALIKEAYRQDYRPEFTDDATVLESAGYKINLVEGDPANIKITETVDLKMAGYLISSQG